MSFALSKAAPLKAEIRLAQAVSQFEADLPCDKKADFRSQKSKTCKNPPGVQDVMYLTAKIDWETSRKTGGGRCFGPRFTNVLQAVQQFAALGDVIVGGSQNIIACGVWSLVRMTLLVCDSSSISSFAYPDPDLTLAPQVSRQLLFIYGEALNPFDGSRPLSPQIPKIGAFVSQVSDIAITPFRIFHYHCPALPPHVQDHKKDRNRTIGIISI